MGGYCEPQANSERGELVGEFDMSVVVLFFLVLAFKELEGVNENDCSDVCVQLAPGLLDAFDCAFHFDQIPALFVVDHLEKVIFRVFLDVKDPQTPKRPIALPYAR